MAKRSLLRCGVLLVSLAFVAHLSAQGSKGFQGTPEEFEAKLGYQTGTVTVQGGMATIRVPPSFRYLGAEGGRRLLTEGWGNPAAATTDVLGMLVPKDVSPLAPAGWGIVVTYDEDGYVNDDDAGSIDYRKMLTQMQEASVAANAEREKQGFDSVAIIGWAEPPSYDRATHKLYWAKELKFGKAPDHTLNYNIRILGRRGVLVLNAVAAMSQLSSIRNETRDVLAAIDFNEGHRYSDYLPGKDKAATYGIAGLIVGATAAKAGFFKLLWVGILAFKKLIVVAFVAVGAMLKRLFGRGAKGPDPEPTQTAG